MPHKITFYDFLVEEGGVFKHDADSPEEAYEYGHKLREVIEQEGFSEMISVEINVFTVRARVIPVQVEV